MSGVIGDIAIVQAAMTATATPTVARLLRDDFGNFFGNFVRFHNLRIGELRGLLELQEEPLLASASLRYAARRFFANCP